MQPGGKKPGDLSDIALDRLLDEPVLKEIPLIKTIVACCKTWQAAHDRLFLRKVARFLLAYPEFTEAERDRFLNEDLQDPRNRKQLGDALVLILDKLDDFDKPAMLAKLFAAHVRGQCTYPEFRVLAKGKPATSVPETLAETLSEAFLRIAAIEQVKSLSLSCLRPPPTTAHHKVFRLFFLLSEFGRFVQPIHSEGRVLGSPRDLAPTENE